MEHKGWYSRGYLPHFDRSGLVQMLTFRLVDSVPASVLKRMESMLKWAPKSVWRRKIENYLDQNHGCCYIRDKRIARMVENALLHFDGLRYRLTAWAVMPNHVHALIEQMRGHRLGQVVHSWKSFTSQQANRILHREGTFWQPDYFDRYIRDVEHYEATIKYIHENPVKAGLAGRPEDWPFSSAARLQSGRVRVSEHNAGSAGIPARIP